MALKLDILANTRQMVSEMKKAGASVDEISESLDDMVREGEKSGDKLERNFRDMARAAEKAGDDIERGVGGGLKKAGKDVEKFGDKAKSELGDSAREGAQSFTGEFSDVQDVLQETVANLGPAGVVGAAIIGSMVAVATQAVEAWNEKIQGIKDATADMWQEAAEEGQSFVDTSAIQAEAHRILWDEAYKADLKVAEEAGIKRSQFAIALATGEGAVYEQVHQQLIDAEKEKQAEALRTQGVFRDNYDAQILAESTETQAIQSTINLLDEKAKTVDDNKRKAQQAADIIETLNEQERAQIQRTRDASISRWEAEAEARERAGRPVVVPVVADTAQFDRAIRRVRATSVSVTGNVVYRLPNGRFLE